MHCTRCNTALWKVRSRECPACEAAFKPSDYRFRPQTVRFCCPHCGQGYLGNGDDGLPEPRRFECVYCGRWINADEMVLEIATGVEEHKTRPDALPWIETHRAWGVRWALTVWIALVEPRRLMQLTPRDMPAKPAVVFMLATQCGLAVAATLAAWVSGTLLALPGGSRAFGVLTPGGLARLLGAMVLTGVFAAAWVRIAHAVAHRRGGRRGAGQAGRGVGTLSRTVQAVCLTSTPHALWFLPVFGAFAGWIGTAVWARSAVSALAEAHGLTPKRARLAGGAWPAACLAIGLVVWGATAFGVLPSWGPREAVWAASDAESVSRFDAPIRTLLGQGRTPVHAAELMSDGSLRPGDFCAPGSRTTVGGVELAGTTLAEFGLLAPARQLAVIQQAAAQLPAGLSAHRLGDFVFVFDAVAGREPGLWIAVEAWDPAHNAANGPIHVLHADGSVRSIAGGEVSRGLLAQNRLRVGVDLPMLGDPRQLREPGG